MYVPVFRNVPHLNDSKPTDKLAALASFLYNVVYSEIKSNSLTALLGLYQAKIVVIFIGQLHSTIGPHFIRSVGNSSCLDGVSIQSTKCYYRSRLNFGDILGVKRQEVVQLDDFLQRCGNLIGDRGGMPQRLVWYYCLSFWHHLLFRGIAEE